MSETPALNEFVTLRSRQVFDLIKADGEEEMARPARSLFFSAIAAGFAIGFSVVAEAVMKARLPADEAWSPLIYDSGYTIGFLIVVLARLQLFTENTITPVFAVLERPSRGAGARLARLWGVVLAGNMLGAVVFAAFMMLTPAISDATQDAILALGRHASDGGFWATVARGVGAGFLIAAMVWMLAGVRSGEPLIVFLLTYVIAICGFAHVVAGAVEMTALVLAGQMTAVAAAFGFVLPALIGNVIGGTGLFALLSYAQVADEEP